MTAASTDPERLAGLADRCEAASGADRYLDYDIALAVLPHLEKIPASKWMYEATGAKHEMFTVMFDDGARRYMYSAEAYTASLDAAMSLVPEGQDFLVDRRGSTSCAWVSALPAGQAVRSDATTPALALCAASLRARAHQETRP